MNPVMHDSDEWRNVQKRLGYLEEKVNGLSSTVARLMDRQQMQHEENKSSIERIGRMLVGEKGDNGLVGTVSGMKGQLESVKDSVDEIKEVFKHLPRTILTILMIFSILIALLTFLGPSIRKAIGLAASQHMLIAPMAATSQDAGAHYTAR